MQRPCYNDLSKEDHSPCCRESVFPFEENVFHECLLLAVEDLYETPSFLWLPGVAGPKFDIETRKVSAAVIEYESSQAFNFNYQEIHNFYTEVEEWFQDILRSAPPQLQNGFFVSYFEFYDLQRSLQEGTLIAIAVAMAVAFVVLLLSTQNLVLSIFAITTVLSIIVVTVAVLILIGWKLNILESVVITLAIGLSVDFTLHYGIMYKLSGESDRDKSVTFSIATMASPVCMAAFTTLCAGVCLLPTRVLAYIQIGTFITVLMSVSWLFSTFFFQSIMRSWGPTKSSSFNLSRCACCKLEEEEKEPVQKAFTVSETVISQVSSNSVCALENPQPPFSPQNKMASLDVTSRQNGHKQTRSMSCSRQLETPGQHMFSMNGGNHHTEHREFIEGRSRSHSCANGLQAQTQEQKSVVAVTQATLHNRPCHRPDVSPSRKSLHEPLFVSDGQTIRCDPYHHMSLKRERQGSVERDDRMRRRLTLPSASLLAKEEDSQRCEETQRKRNEESHALSTLSSNHSMRKRTKNDPKRKEVGQERTALEEELHAREQDERRIEAVLEALRNEEDLAERKRKEEPALSLLATRSREKPMGREKEMEDREEKKNKDLVISKTVEDGLQKWDEDGPKIRPEDGFRLRGERKSRRRETTVRPREQKGVMARDEEALRREDEGARRRRKEGMVRLGNNGTERVEELTASSLDAVPQTGPSLSSPALSCPVPQSTSPQQYAAGLPPSSEMSSGAIPKHTRKKSLPDSSFKYNSDSSQTPYTILDPHITAPVPAPRVRIPFPVPDPAQRSPQVFHKGEVLKLSGGKDPVPVAIIPQESVEEDRLCWAIKDFEARLVRQERVIVKERRGEEEKRSGEERQADEERICKEKLRGEEIMTREEVRIGMELRSDEECKGEETRSGKMKIQGDGEIRGGELRREDTDRVFHSLQREMSTPETSLQAAIKLGDLLGSEDENKIRRRVEENTGGRREQEKVFHSLERGRNTPESTSLQAAISLGQLPYELTESLDWEEGLDDATEDSLSLLQCVTPAPREFGDSAEPELENILVSDTPVPSTQGVWEQERRKTVGGINIRREVGGRNSSSKIGNRKSFNGFKDLQRPGDLKERHPHSRSTETILMAGNDSDPQPIVPNRKPGTPDIWLPQTVRA